MVIVVLIYKVISTTITIIYIITIIIIIIIIIIISTISLPSPSLSSLYSLVDMGIERSTLVVVASDNGPEASFETDSAGEKLVGWSDVNGWMSVSMMCGRIMGCLTLICELSSEQLYSYIRATIFCSGGHD